MASTYTPLGVELMATGENAGTWGTKTNTNLQLIEQISGGYKVQTLNTDGAGANTTTLTEDDGSPSTSVFAGCHKFYAKRCISRCHCLIS